MSDNETERNSAMWAIWYALDACSHEELMKIPKVPQVALAEVVLSMLEDKNFEEHVLRVIFKLLNAFGDILSYLPADIKDEFLFLTERLSQHDNEEIKEKALDVIFYISRKM